MDKKSQYINLALFVLLAFLWSGSFINIKIVVDALPPILSAMIRVLVSLICISFLFILTRKKIFVSPSLFWQSWIAGLFAQALPFAFLFYGEKFIAPALASILNSTTSFWALLLGTFLFRDFSQWTPLKLIGLITGFFGIVLIFFPYIHKGETSLIGIISVMGMAISYAVGGLINQHVIFKNMRISFEANLYQQHIASVIILTMASLMLEPWPSIHTLFTAKTLFAFLYLGVMATAIAWFIYFYLIKEWGAVRAASVMYIVPLLAIVWDLLFLHLIPSQVELMGAFFILLGVTLIQVKRKVLIAKTHP